MDDGERMATTGSTTRSTMEPDIETKILVTDVGVVRLWTYVTYVTDGPHRELRQNWARRATRPSTNSAPFRHWRRRRP